MYMHKHEISADFNLIVTKVDHQTAKFSSFTVSLDGIYLAICMCYRFYEEFVLRSNYEECRNYLREFNLSIDKVCESTCVVFLLSLLILGFINQFKCTQLS